METFELILLLLGAVLISTVLTQLIPRVSLPLVQIAIGIVVALLSVAPVEFHVDPELFLILFIAPLLFDESRHVSKRDLWNNKGSILSLAIGLVLLTVLVVGFVLHWFIPSLPLAAAFALGAALGPTDAVAVSALSKDVSITPRQKSLLSGESLINDASGVVSFQFAIAAAVTGVFSVTEAGETFMVSFLGGVAIGLLLGAIGMVALRIVREHGLESTTAHVVFELFLPFIIFFIAEHIHVSGILAVVAAGLLITLFPQKLTPMVSRLNLVSKSVWGVVVFIINGVIFVLLGMELPQAFMSEWDSDHINGNLQLIGYVLLVTFLIVGVRFLWIAGMNFLRRDPETKAPDFGLTGALLRDALITTLAGPKGAISLSIAFTIPYTVSSGAGFPYRGFLIFIASGTILCTLLLANFLVPLLAPKKEASADDRRKIDVDIEILQNVVAELKLNQTAETTVATGIVVRHYKDRIRQLRQQEADGATLRKLRIETMEFQGSLVEKLVGEGAVSEEIGESYLKRLTRMKDMLTRSKQAKGIFESMSSWRKNVQRLKGRPGELAHEEEFHNLRIKVEQQTITHLEQRLAEAGPREEKCVAALLADHKSMVTELNAEAELFKHYDPKLALSHVKDVESEGLRLELDHIQQMYEDDRLTRDDAVNLREEVYLMQASLNS